MHAALQALTEELRRLKSTGVKTVSVPEETVAALRQMIAARKPPGIQKPSTVAAPTFPSAPPRGETPPGARAPRLPVPETGHAAGQPSVVPTRPRPPAPAVPPAPTLPAAPVVNLPPGDKPARWAALREMVTQDATCCARVRPGKKVVLGVGSLDARIMFVGEAPGAEEEIQGEPFVGPAGQLLTRMIQAMGLKREDVYIGNIMNWRPDIPTPPGAEQIGNRPPNEEEMRYCLPYLRAQIDVVNPAVLVALGSTAAQGLLGFGSFKALGDIRGKWHAFSGKPLMVTYHPSYILRNQSNRSKRMIWEDLLKVMERVALPITEKQRGYFL